MTLTAELGTKNSMPGNIALGYAPLSDYTGAVTSSDAAIGGVALVDAAVGGLALSDALVGGVEASDA